MTVSLHRERPPSSGFSALILSAGRSSRMGAFKPLLPLGEETLLERAIRRSFLRP